MGRTLSCEVRPEDVGSRLDVFLANRNCYASRSEAVRYIEDGKVFVNGKVVDKKTPIKLFDTIVYEEAPKVKHIPMVGQNIPLDIRYDDPYMLVISKQAGLCVHPSGQHEDHTLVNALIYRYGRDHLAHVQGDDRPGIVHRLDMYTSGLMMCAKQDTCGDALQEAIRLKQIDRRYLTLVHGNIAHDTGLIDEPITRDESNRFKMRVGNGPKSRGAITTFNVLERFAAGPKDDGYTLLECKLFTGRTHQIRVHMHFIGHCCVGDPMYGSGDAKQQLGVTRQFLHSYSLNFEHPITHDHLSFLDSWPPDLAKAMKDISDRSLGRTQAGEEILTKLAHAPHQSKDIQLDSV